MNIQKWSPDTCGCVLLQKVEDGVISYCAVERKCEFHANLGDEEAYDAVKAENYQKNEVYMLMHTISSLIEEKASEEVLNVIANEARVEIIPSQVSKVIRENIKYIWNYDDQRNLIVYIHGANQQETDALKLLLKDKNVTIL